MARNIISRCNVPRFWYLLSFSAGRNFDFAASLRNGILLTEQYSVGVDVLVDFLFIKTRILQFYSPLSALNFDRPFILMVLKRFLGHLLTVFADIGGFLFMILFSMCSRMAVRISVFDG